MCRNCHSLLAVGGKGPYLLDRESVLGKECSQCFVTQGLWPFVSLKIYMLISYSKFAFYCDQKHKCNLVILVKRFTKSVLTKPLQFCSLIHCFHATRPLRPIPLGPFVPHI